MQIVIATILAILTYFFREWLEANRVVNGIIAETEDSLHRLKRHKSRTDFDALYKRIRKDKKYYPFISAYPPPYDLYRKAIFDVFMIGKVRTKLLIKAYKSEIEIEEFIKTGQTTTYKDMSIERRVAYYRQYRRSIDELERNLRRANKFMRSWPLRWEIRKP